MKVKGSAKVGRRPTIVTVPADAKKYVRITNKAQTKKDGYSTLHISRKYGSGTITVTGKVNQGVTELRAITVDDPKMVAGRLFRRELERAGVRVLGGTTTGSTPQGLGVLARDRSMPLSELLVPFLKLSNNSHGEALTKGLAAEATGRGTWAGGTARLRAYLHDAGVDPAGVRLMDGSGLARADKLTATALTQVLVHARTQPWFASYYRALPVAGESDRMVGGALRYRMANTRAEGNAHAKTGWMQGVTSLAGYVRDRDGRLYAFAMIGNYTRVSPRPVEDRLVLVLARHERRRR